MLTAQGFAAGRAQQQQQPQGNQGAFAAYGQAQPQQPQSQGTPYNPQQGQNFGGQRQVQFGMPDQQRNQAMTAWAQPKQQLLQWGQNLPQYQQHQPQQGMQPQDLWARNSALVQQINDSQANQEVGTWLGQGAPPPNWGNQNLNPQAMLQQAQAMLQQGWQNPFGQVPQSPTQQPGPPFATAAPQSQGQHQDLFQQFGFTPPAGFMDALIQRLQGGAGQPGAAGAPAQDHRAAYEQQQQRASAAQQRDSLAKTFGLQPAGPGGQASDSQIWQAFAQNPQNVGPVHVQSLKDAGLVSDSEAAQLLREVQAAQQVARDSNFALHSLGARNDPQFLQRAAQDKWHQEHGLMAQLPKRAQYAEFLTQRGVLPDEARQLAEQQYPVKTQAEEISRLGALQADLQRQLGLPGSAAQGDPTERARLRQQANDIGDQIRALKGQPTRAEQQQADAAKAQQAANWKAAQNTPEALAQKASGLQANLAAAKRGEALSGVSRTVQQREQELRQAQQQLAQSRQSAISQQGFRPSMFMEGGVFNMPAAREAWKQLPEADRQRARANMDARDRKLMSAVG
jgi:hypothetical protein